MQLFINILPISFVIYQNKNLGILTTLRIGHDNAGASPKLMIEHVVVRNEVTGHTYKSVFIIGYILRRYFNL